MSDRYWITGVQLGVLITIPSHKQRQDLVNEIVDKQFIGNSNEQDEDELAKIIHESIVGDEKEEGK